ncbi:MAG: SPOR domain-containing protein [Bacteroidales bacterium]|nr:SPOR domain-containing protein [Candidatus Physcousia equi]
MMNELVSNIEYLLLSYNRVIVPGLGEFTSRLTPARWVDTESIFLPPVRNVYFSNATKEDTQHVFIKSVAQLYRLSPEKAQERCQAMVNEFHKTLITQGTVDFGSFGVFTLEDDASITMASCECGISTPYYYGLDALSVDKIASIFEHTWQMQEEAPQDPQPCEMQTMQSAAPSSTGRAVSAPTEQKHFVLRIHRSVVKYSMAVAASLALFFVVNPTRTSGRSEQMATANIFMQPDMVPQKQLDASFYYVDDLPEENAVPLSDSILVDYTHEAINEGFDLSALPENAPTTSLDIPTAVSQPAAPPPVAKPSPTAAPAPVAKPASPAAASAPVAKPASAANVSSQEGYCIVLASSISEANAKNFIEKQNKNGVNASLFVKDNMRRVVVDGFKNEADCRAAMAKLKAEHPDLISAWLLKK